MSRLLFLGPLLLLVGCLAAPPRRIGPDGYLPEVAWTEAELARDVAARPLREVDGLRILLVRLRTAEEPHTHPYEDLTVFVLEGAGQIHFGDRSHSMAAGDVIEIPAGVEHWAENTSARPALAYAVFTPSAQPPRL